MEERTEPFISDIGFYSKVGTGVVWNPDGHAATISAIDKILGLLPERDNWCVEFGAWDGLVGSTSRALITGQNYSAVLIEGSAKKFKDLLQTYKGFQNVFSFNQYVGFDKETGLDSILEKTAIPRNFDFLSIDIDGNDYHVWNAMEKYQPKVLIIEFNPTIPPEVDFIQPADPSTSQGASLSEMIKLGKKKGYELVGVLSVNAFFVLREYYPLYQIKDNSIYALWTNRDCVTYLFSGYDGRIFLRGCQRLPWHCDLPIREGKMQALPAMFRHAGFTRNEKLLFTCFSDPMTMICKILSRLSGLFSSRKKS